MYSRLIEPPKDKSFFLFGPRGTGKTTWVKSRFKNALYLDLLEAELFNDLLANPQRLENLIPKNFKEWVIIDEVQRIPELLNEVHRLIEKYRYKFVLTGSRFYRHYSSFCHSGNFSRKFLIQTDFIVDRTRNRFDYSGFDNRFLLFAEN